MTLYVYIGTYTQTGRGQGHRPEGIYQYRFDPLDGSLSLVGAARDTLNPSFLAVHPNRRFLYAANELGEGAVSAFAIQPRTGELAFLNSQPTGGAAPCYVSCDPTGHLLMVANYSSGNHQPMTSRIELPDLRIVLLYLGLLNLDLVFQFPDFGRLRNMDLPYEEDY